jgi:hypothetical protein
VKIKCVIQTCELGSRINALEAADSQEEDADGGRTIVPVFAFPQFSDASNFFLLLRSAAIRPAHGQKQISKSGCLLTGGRSSVFPAWQQLQRARSTGLLKCVEMENDQDQPINDSDLSRPPSRPHTSALSDSVRDPINHIVRPPNVE